MDPDRSRGVRGPCACSLRGWCIGASRTSLPAPGKRSPGCSARSRGCRRSSSPVALRTGGGPGRSYPPTRRARCPRGLHTPDSPRGRGNPHRLPPLRHPIDLDWGRRPHGRCPSLHTRPAGASPPQGPAETPDRTIVPSIYPSGVRYRETPTADPPCRRLSRTNASVGDGRGSFGALSRGCRS